MRHKKMVLIGLSVIVLVGVMVGLFLAFRPKDERSVIAAGYQNISMPSSLALKSKQWHQEDLQLPGVDAGSSWLYAYTIPAGVSTQGLKADINKMLSDRKYITTSILGTDSAGEFGFKASRPDSSLKYYFLIGYNDNALQHGWQQPGNLVYLVIQDTGY